MGFRWIAMNARIARFSYFWKFILNFKFHYFLFSFKITWVNLSNSLRKSSKKLFLGFKYQPEFVTQSDNPG